jgi:hypothetical protein
MTQKTACPCCEYLTLEDEPGHFDICPVCFWEDDPIQRDDIEYDGGAGGHSVASVAPKVIMEIEKRLAMSLGKAVQDDC